VKRQRFPSWFPAVAVGFGVLVVALVGWLAFVSPQKSKAKSLGAQIEATQREITDLRLLARPVSDAQTVKVADVFRLSKAMPTKVDMPGILLELNRIAGESGISFDLVTPKAVSTVNGIQAVPIDLAFKGTFYDLSDFVYRLRNLVRVQRGRLAATGRLFTVESLTFTKAQEVTQTENVEVDPALKIDPNRIDASMSVNAYVFTGPAPDAAAATPGAETTGTETTTTAATTTASTPPPAGEASASGATP
jgi:Tfp pilus assembly protein PilO